MDTFRLTVELVPSTQWGVNLRTALPKEQWDILRRECYRKAKYKCEICGGKGSKWPIEGHEIWKYDDVNHIQKLMGLIGLCPSCHQVKHFGKAQLDGNGEKALEHLQKVNGITYTEAINYIHLAFQIWEDRSQYQWELDLNWLEEG